MSSRALALLALMIAALNCAAIPDLLVYHDSHGVAHEIRNRQQWAEQRARILENIQKVMGPLPRRIGVPPEVLVLEETTLPKYVRKKITYLAENQDRVPAYLFVPIARSGKFAAILCLHQTTRIGKAEPAGLGGNPNLSYAAELAALGYVTLAPDYPNFGEYTSAFCMASQIASICLQASNPTKCDRDGSARSIGGGPSGSAACAADADSTSLHTCIGPSAPPPGPAYRRYGPFDAMLTRYGTSESARTASDAARSDQPVARAHTEIQGTHQFDRNATDEDGAGHFSHGLRRRPAAS